MRGKWVLYVDQYGNKFGAHSLKQLREQVSGRVSKMYVDKKVGGTVHCGYVVGQHWLTAYIPLELPA
jgi:hypothetical protein